MFRFAGHRQWVYSENLRKMYREGKKVFLDVKGLLDKKELQEAGFLYWRL